MKQEEDKIVKGFRKCLENYSEPVPSGLWDSLEKELEIVPVRNRLFRHWKIVAAAAVVVGVFSTAGLFFLHMSQTEYIQNTQAVVQEVLPDVLPGPLVPQEKINKVNNVEQLAYVAQSKRKTTDDAGSTVESVLQSTVSSETVEVVTDEARKEGNNAQEQYVVNRKTVSERNSDAHRTLALKRQEKRDKEWSVGISAGNTPLAVDQTREGFRNIYSGAGAREVDPYSITELMTDDDLSNEIIESERAYRQILINSINKEVYTHAEHRMPFTVGVSFRYELSPVFSVETGVNYTLLSSKLWSGTGDDYYSQQQRLHYVGIPLKGNWSFLKKKYFSFYLSAGGAMEKCVSGSLKSDFVSGTNVLAKETEDIKVKPLQWSVGAAVGVQYNATRHFGLFVEPGMVYYFDDGSQVQTIRKEKPFNFNLQMGLRFTY